MLGMYRPANLVLMRHAEYYWNSLYHCNFELESLDDVPPQIIGVEEQLVPLTPEGREQATATGQGLAKMFPEGFHAIFYSPWQRVEETLEYVLAGWPAETRLKMKDLSRMSDALAEQYQGDGVQFLDPHNREMWPTQFKRLQLLLELKHRDYTKYRRRGLSTGDPIIDGPTHTGESQWEVRNRIGSFLQRIFTRHYSGKNILVVSHLASIMWLRGALEHLTPQQVVADLNRQDKKFAISNCGVFHYQYKKDLPRADHWHCECWNKTFYDGAFQET